MTTKTCGVRLFFYARKRIDLQRAMSNLERGIGCLLPDGRGGS